MSPQSGKRKSLYTRKRRLPVAERAPEPPVETDVVTMARSEREDMPSCSSQNMNNLDEPVGSMREEMSQEGSSGNAPVSRQKRKPKSSEEEIYVDAARLPCMLCEKVILSKTEMTKHLKSHHPPGETTCKICRGKKMSSRSSLDRHFLVHSGEQPFKCPECPRRFTTCGNVSRHVKHLGHFGKKKAGESINTVNEPTVSPASIADSPASTADSPPSGVYSLPSEALSLPSSRVAQSGSPPSGADSSFSEPPSAGVSQEGVIDSQPNRSRKRSNTSESPPAKKARAEASKKPIERQVKVKSKVKGGPPPPLLFQFPFSLSKFPLLANTKEAQDTMPRKDTPLYRCARCHEAFLDLESLREHETSHRMEMSVPDSDLLCPSCQVAHGSFCEFASHRMSTAEPEDPDSSQSRFLKQFDLYENAEPNSQVVVPGANSQAAEIVALTNAQEGIRNSNANSQTEEEDTDSQQEDQDPVTVAYAILQDVEYSERSSENNNDFADIGSILSNVSVSPQHQSGLESLMSMPQVDPRNCRRKGKPTIYRCEVEGCDYASCDKSGVRRHNMTHTKEQPFICKFKEGENSSHCNVKFTTKSNGERHARSIHNLTDEESSSVIEFNYTSGLVFECPYECGEVFNSEKAREHHLRATKTKSACRKKPFQCGECRQGFGSKNNYNRHFKDKHRASLSDERFEEERVKNCIEIKTKPRKDPGRTVRGSTLWESAQSIQPPSVLERYESESLQVRGMMRENNLRNGHHLASPSTSSNGESIEKTSSSEEDDQPNGMSEVSPGRDSGIASSEEEPLDLSLHALDLRSNSYPMHHFGSTERSHTHTSSDRSIRMFLPFPSFSPTFASPILHRAQVTPPLAALPLDLSQRVPPCNFCGKTFSSRASRDLHIQKDHSGHGVPTRVLQNTDDNIQQQFVGERKQPVAIGQGGSDTENVDLADVRSVIDTANSPCFGQYLLTSCDASAPHQKGKSKENIRRKWNDQAKHAGKKRFECKVCGTTFTNKSNMTRHSKKSCHPRPSSSSLSSPGLLTTEESPENSSDAREC